MAQDGKIRKLRKDRGLTLEQVAEAVGVSAAQISRWETKGASISPVKLERLASALAVSISEIADGRGSRQHIPPPDLPIPVYPCEFDHPLQIEDGCVEALRIGITPTNGLEIERVSALEHRADVYALRIRGEGMAPDLLDGELVLLDTVSVRAGDLVAIFLKRGRGNAWRRVLIKRLASLDVDYAVFEQRSPAGKFALATEQIEQIHRIMRVQDILTLKVA